MMNRLVTLAMKKGVAGVSGVPSGPAAPAAADQRCWPSPLMMARLVWWMPRRATRRSSRALSRSSTSAGTVLSG
jgi:hypothetical protein